MRLKALFALAFSIGQIVGCAQGKEEKKEGKDSKASSTAEESEGDGGAGGDALPPSDEIDNGLYTGIGGGKDYSIILPGFRSYTSSDESIAKVEKVTVTLSETAIKDLIKDLKKVKPDADEACIKKMFARERSSYKITPLKAGTVKLKSARPKNRRSGGFKKNNETMTLVITEYTDAQLAAGEKRYTTDGGGGNLVSCKSCHASGEEGAPPHEMGRVMEISDQEALQWIKTGQVGDRKAEKVEHKWQFSSDEDEAGIVPYLRSLQTKDIETLTKLYFEEARVNGFDGGFGGGGGPGGGGGGPGGGGPGGQKGSGPGGRGCKGGDHKPADGAKTDTEAGTDSDTDTATATGNNQED